MNNIYRIKDNKGIKNISPQDFPIEIGGSVNAGISITNLGKQEAVAHVHLREGQLFIHLAQTNVSVNYNRKTLKGSACLTHGDELQIGSTMICYFEEEGRVTFQITAQGELHSYIPPASVPVDQIIEPVQFRSDRLHTPSRLSSRLKKPLGIILGIVFLFLSFSAWFVFTSKQLVVQIEPTPDRVAMQGGLFTPKFSKYYLLRPGSYVLEASKQGYRRIEHPVTISNDKSTTLTLVMEKLPGRLTITAHHEGKPDVTINGATVYIDEEEVGTTPLSSVDMKSGLRQLTVKAKDYLNMNTQFNVEGMGVEQSFTVALIPGWAEIKLQSIPVAANIFVDGSPMGKTPAVLKLQEGTYALEINANGYKTWHVQLETKANQSQVLDNIQLQPADGILVLRTEPSEANIMIDGTIAGQTPFRRHTVSINRTSYPDF